MANWVIIGVLVGLLALLIVSNLARKAELGGFWGTLLKADLPTSYWLWGIATVALFVGVGFFDPLAGKFGNEFKLWTWYQGLHDYEGVRIPLVGAVLKFLLAFLLLFYALTLGWISLAAGFIIQGICVAAVTCCAGRLRASRLKETALSEPEITSASTADMNQTNPGVSSGRAGAKTDPATRRTTWGKCS